jgi:predicted PurR-regulated permease PerM
MGVGADIRRSLGAWLKASLQNAVITVLLFCAGFAIAGVPWWLLSGAICGVVNLVPYLGPVLALGLGLLIEFLATANWTALAAVAGVWLTVQIIDGFILSPRAAGRSGVNPLLSIVLVLVAGLIFGPLGMILVVPVVAVLLILMRAVRKQGRMRLL